MAMKILMVCLGNICRSPIAEGIVKKKLHQTGLKATVDSAGLLSYHAGEQPDPRAMETAARFGIDISDQRARQISPGDFDKFDLILAMDNNVFSELCRMSQPQTRSKIHLFLDFSGFPEGSEVPDPYYGTMRHFEDCYRLIYHASDALVKRIITGVSV
jgi:protein-tyrosine phosphatase